MTRLSTAVQGRRRTQMICAVLRCVASASHLQSTRHPTGNSDKETHAGQLDSSCVSFIFGSLSFRRDQGPLGRHHSLAAVSLRCTPDAVELQGNDTEQGHGANNG
jgi:hypothetical protein